jgi:hypothetical protein
MKFAILAILFVVTFSTPTFHRVSSQQTLKAGRDQELFVAGAKALSEDKFDAGRMVLRTLINTYPDSPFVEQAKLLVFFSMAREGGPKNQKATELLKTVEETVESYIHKNQIPVR